eukprot:7875059-Lingulodinium_polyedra.AAC.1
MPPTHLLYVWSPRRCPAASPHEILWVARLAVLPSVLPSRLLQGWRLEPKWLRKMMIMMGTVTDDDDRSGRMIGQEG